MKMEIRRLMTIFLCACSIIPGSFSCKVLRDRAEVTKAVYDAVKRGDIDGAQAVVVNALKHRSRAEIEKATNALFDAVESNNATAVCSALEGGADVQGGGCGWTPLHVAAGRERLEALEALLEAGAALEAVDSGGNRPLHWAARGGRDATVSRLVKAGADLHSPGNLGLTPLELAVLFRRRSTEALLRSLGAVR